MKSGITHGDAEPCGDAEKPPILRSLVPDVDPNARPRLEWNPPEYLDKIADVLRHRKSKFTGAGSIISVADSRQAKF